MFGTGISFTGELVDTATELGIIKMSASWFSYGDSKIGQGRDAVLQLLGENKELSKEIEDKVRAQMKGENFSADLSDEEKVEDPEQEREPEE